MVETFGAQTRAEEAAIVMHLKEVVSQPEEIAMLTILLATCETTLQTFAAAKNPLDQHLAEDLKRVVARTRQELDSLTKAGRNEGTRRDSSASSAADGARFEDDRFTSAPASDGT